MKVELLQGDISEVKADAIVNAASTELKMGGGVAASLKARGGKEIEEEALKSAPIGLGQALVTGAGKLNARYVIHAAAMSWEPFRVSEESIAMSVRNSLKKADELECKTIALPAVGCGIAMFSLERGAKTILKEVMRFKPISLEKALIVLFSSKEFEAFKKTLNRLRG
jgi:O-acetyl-ADP-ribose deacetylase (regulator of RNase III)